GEAGIVNDATSRALLQEALRQQSHDVVALNEIGVLIEEETAVEVTIPGDAHVCAVLTNSLDGGLAVLLQQRVGDTIGEVTVGLMMHPDELEGEMGCQQIHDGSGTPVAGIDHQFQWLEGS